MRLLVAGRYALFMRIQFLFLATCPGIKSKPTELWIISAASSRTALSGVNLLLHPPKNSKEMKTTDSFLSISSSTWTDC